MMDQPSQDNERESPRFYHFELYDSTEDLEMFSEEPFRRRDLFVREFRKNESAVRPADSQIAESETLPGDSAGSGASLVPDDNNKDTDQYCITCCIPVRAVASQTKEHLEHEVIPLASVVEIAKNALQENVCKLEDHIRHLESFSSHLEEIFITVEENFARQEQQFEKQYGDLMQILEQRYEDGMQALGEEKKEKLEVLYEKLVSCGANLDTCKELMETIEALGQGANKVEEVKTAVTSMLRLDNFLKKDVDLDLSTPADFETQVLDTSDIPELMNSVSSVPVPSPPSAPVMNSQDPNSATGTSVRVCWSFFSEDIVESYHLYYKQVSNTMSKEEQEEFMINVKETYCTVVNLTPNTQYEFWVKALNRAGVGSASERAVYITAPLPPIIKTKEIQTCEHAALVRWSSGNTNPVDSYTAELSKITSEEGGDNIITESVVGIPNCETLIPLEPGQNYLLSVKAINMGGTSEPSGPISLISTGTSFTLHEETAHPFLSVLEDGLTLTCHKTGDSRNELSFPENSFTRSIAILGNPIPFDGKHYWEVEVDENIEYYVGVAFENVSRDSYLGTSHASWCMRHVIDFSSHAYEFLHNSVTPDIRITVPPKRIGILLDYDKGTLTFFNADLHQHLHTFHGRFWDFVCPCFALEEPGTLRIRNGIATPSHFLLW